MDEEEQLKRLIDKAGIQGASLDELARGSGLPEGRVNDVLCRMMGYYRASKVKQHGRSKKVTIYTKRTCSV